ncbi:MAG: YfhO family protein [Melioribacteraceae bacterium]|nr:YfhO family protein [Melioribacteraceae bacterium]
MFAHITFIATFILGGFGLKALFTEIKQNDYKKVLYVFGGGALFLLIILFTKGSYEYIGPNEAGRYNQQTLEIIKNIRIEFLTTDTIRVLILVGLSGLTALGYLFRKIRKELAVAAILILVGIEIFAITGRQVTHINLVEEEQLEQNAFQETEITQVLKSRDDNMRALAISKEFQSNYYAYFYPTINGYSAIKLQLIQDIIDHNLFNYPSQGKINWNVINMLNGKYIISSNPLNYPFLNKLAEAPKRKEILYENRSVLSKAWFVKETKSFDTPENLVVFMNDPSFKPDSLALLLNSDFDGERFSAKGKVEVEKYTPNEIVLKVNTTEEQFLVLSEVYYPEGWQAVTSEDKELEILKTNHILRGMEIPAGNYSITLTFEPQTYYTSMTVVWVGEYSYININRSTLFN